MDAYQVESLCHLRLLLSRVSSRQLEATVRNCRAENPWTAALCILSLLLLVLLSCMLSACASAAADSPYTLLGTHTFLLTQRYEIVNTSDQPVTNVVIRLLEGATDTPSPPASLGASLYQQRVATLVKPDFSVSYADKLGNVIGFIKLGTMLPGEHRTVSMKKLVKNSNIRFAEDIDILRPDYVTFLADPANARLQQFVKPSPHIECDSPKIKDDVLHLDPTKSPVAMARDIYAAVNSKLTFDPNPIYSHQGAVNALHTRRGVCADFAALFVAYCRAMNIPARVVGGYWIDETVLPTMRRNVPLDVTPHLHAWAEFYLPGVGWIPVEPTSMMTIDGVRVADIRHFAALQANERHFITGYGLEIEHLSDFSFRYTSQTQDGGCTCKLIEQTVTWVKDDATTID